MKSLSSSDIHEMITILKKEWSHLKTPANARSKCTEYLSQLRYILDDLGIPYKIKSCDIVVGSNFIGAHDFIEVDGMILDFTLSQFSLGLEWPYFGPYTKFHKNVVPMSLSEDTQGRDKASKIVASESSLDEIEQWIASNNRKLEEVYIGLDLDEDEQENLTGTALVDLNYDILLAALPKNLVLQVEQLRKQRDPNLEKLIPNFGMLASWNSADFRAWNNRQISQGNNVYIDRVKAHLGSGFDAWLKKQGGDPEANAYNFVTWYNNKYASNQAAIQYKAQLDAALSTALSQLNNLKKMHSPPVEDFGQKEWQDEVDRLNLEIKAIMAKIDPKYSKPI